MNLLTRKRLILNKALLIVYFGVALVEMTGCSKQATPQSPPPPQSQSPAPQSPVPQSKPPSTPQPEAKIDTTGGCKNFPHEIFRLGMRVEINEFPKLLDSNCPKAKSYPDGRVEVTHLGSRYVIKTVRLDISGTEYFEVQSVKLNEGQSAGDPKGQVQ